MIRYLERTQVLIRTPFGKSMAALLILAYSSSLYAQELLSAATVPTPPEIGEYLKTDAGGEVTAAAKEAVIKLGKALFWDIQVGSDGLTACATCHQTAFVDARITNTTHPGPNGEFDIANDGPGTDLVSGDFPFHRLTVPTDRESTLLSSIDDIVGSQGVVAKHFVKVFPNPPIDGDPSIDKGTPRPVPFFGTEHRQVTGRNTPPFVNAIFNDDNFWDGRARGTFNGVNPGGPDAPIDRPIMMSVGGVLSKKVVVLTNSSLASQAVGPPNNEVEMAWLGRTFQALGRKMLNLQPLRKQEVHVDDSVLGDCRDGDGTGLSVSYRDLIKDAFQRKYWKHPAGFFADADGNLVPAAPQKYKLIAWNFSLFWGVSVQCYAQTLVSDRSRFDKFLEGNESALNESEERGMGTFFGAGGCARCHGGPELTFASVAGAADGEDGFRFLGIRPIADDPGRGPIDGLGDGRFKIPGLRNVELTGPYFHKGSALTLQQVVQAYTRGIRNFDEDLVDDDLKDGIGKLNGSPDDIKDLVRFRKSLTDGRVKNQKVPFDHPSLPLPNGDDVPAVGKDGI